MTKIAVISDTHGQHMGLALPDADILVHCGDFSSHGTYFNAIKFVNWFGAQPHKHKIFIAGNHDLYFEQGNPSDIDMFLKTMPKDVIGFELYINWDAPIILVEGIFDALTIKRNVIPLFGKVLHSKLMQKLVKSSVDRIYIALDNDARKDALKQAETLMSYGKEVYLVEMEGKDANEIGFEQFLNTLEKTVPLNLKTLIEKKLQLL